MAKARRHRPSSVLASTLTTPITSPQVSEYPSEDERDLIVQQDSGRFPFLWLPLELRSKIYGMVFEPTVLPVMDLDPSLFKILHRNKALALFLVCRQVHAESTHFFFSTYTFRIFPVHPGRFFKTKRPLLARLPAKHRAMMTTLELRLGPGWNNPPQGWAVNKALGLEDCTSVRVLKVFVECDPSDGVFQGFRKSEGFYENFSGHLLEGILDALSSVQVVQFDSWSSVKRNGAMMITLEATVKKYQRVTRCIREEQ